MSWQGLGCPIFPDFRFLTYSPTGHSKSWDKLFQTWNVPLFVIIALQNSRSVYTASSLRRSVPPRSRKSCPGDAAILWPHECEKPAGGAVAIVASRTDASARQVDVGRPRTEPWVLGTRPKTLQDQRRRLQPPVGEPNQQLVAQCRRTREIQSELTLLAS